VRDTRDPDQLRRFIEQFPASPRRGEANARLFALERARKEQNVAVVAPPVQPPAPTAPNQQAVAALPLKPAPPATSSNDAERAWAVTKDTSGPGVLQAFIKQFGGTVYGNMARARLKELQVIAAKSPEEIPTAAATDAPACMAQFVPLRQEAEKRAAAIKASAESKAPREQLCVLFKSFSEAEAKVVNFLVANQGSCGIPANAVTESGANHEKTVKTRDRICSGGPVGQD